MSETREGDTSQSLFPILTWKEWWTAANRQTQHRVVSSPSPSLSHAEDNHDHDRLLLLDVRSERDHRRRHLRVQQCRQYRSNLVVVVHIPLTDLKDRLFELPPRQVPFAILMDLCTNKMDDEGSNRKFNADELSGRLQQLEWALSNRSSNNNKKDQQAKRRLVRPRRITAVIAADCDETWTEAAASGLNVVILSSTCTDTAEPKSETTDPSDRRLQYFRPEPRLWQPDPLIEHILLPLLQKELVAHQHSMAVSSSKNENSEILPTLPFEIWDLGSGVGRDTVFLAEELLSTASINSTGASSYNSSTTTSPTFRVVGLDQRYRNKNDNETLSFWKRRNCQNVTECRCVNLDDVEALRAELSGSLGRRTMENADSVENAESVDVGVIRQSSTAPYVRCFYAVRYWNRPLFEEVARLGRTRKFAPGTIVAISQFGKPSVGASWNFAHPKVRHWLLFGLCYLQELPQGESISINYCSAPVLALSLHCFFLLPYQHCTDRRNTSWNETNCPICLPRQPTMDRGHLGKFCTIQSRSTVITVEPSFSLSLGFRAHESDGGSTKTDCA